VGRPYVQPLKQGRILDRLKEEFNEMASNLQEVQYTLEEYEDQMDDKDRDQAIVQVKQTTSTTTTKATTTATTDLM
jgi:hypothetical protein